MAKTGFVYPSRTAPPTASATASAAPLPVEHGADPCAVRSAHSAEKCVHALAPACALCAQGMGMTGLREQVREAFQRTGWSSTELLARSGLDCDRSSLSRKLRGGQPLMVDELEALGKALGLRFWCAPEDAS